MHMNMQTRDAAVCVCVCCGAPKAKGEHGQDMSRQGLYQDCSWVSAPIVPNQRGNQTP